MEDKSFLRACELVKLNLVNFEVNRAFNSIGSNIFIEFGNEERNISKNGKESIRKEWSIWISDASWRISKNGKYLVGSGDSPQIIQLSIQELLGKRLRSFCFLSSFLDVEFSFDDGYKVTTFFNWSEENQWTVFLPDQTNIGIDCSSHEKIANVQNIAKQFSITESYKKLDLLKNDGAITGITYGKNQQPTLHFGGEVFINLQNCMWRLEKNGEYLVGCLDEDENKISKLSELIGRKFKQVEIANSLMDARFQYEDQYTLKTFTCSREIGQWAIFPNLHLSI